MTHNRQNIDDYHAGDTLNIVTTVKDNDGNVVPIGDVEEIEWYLKERPSEDDSEALLSKKFSNNEISISDASNGEYTVVIDGSETVEMDGTKFHISRMEDDDGDISTVFTGKFTIVHD